ncbi:hypothetical protein BDV96DRAFT_654536 [Lophiotrema nucula]|uniref:Major facilitator superfamily domain-containing protein n=1 Tax=Lophiotrema nucula TaxID=690887 RepID=A0A6A5YH06_9PLEO|nr:hypothetical protein BDV96DRAFT_654536 [Lophiotrema nucula]
MSAIQEKNDIQFIDEKAESLHAEKPHQVVQIDNIQVLGLHPDDADFYLNFSEEKKKRVIHKVDVRLVPMLAVLYLVSHIDRANIGNAKIEGLVEDLGLSGIQWNIVLCMLIWYVSTSRCFLVRNGTNTLDCTKYILHTITKAMGFSNTNAQLMTVPPYVAGAKSAIVWARLSDRFYWRLPFVAIPLSFIFIGYSTVISFHGDLAGNIGPAFFAIILTCMGIYPIQPAGSSWAANNLAPANRRAIGVAFNICVGNISGVIGSYMYLDNEKPKYYTGFGLSLAFGATGFLISFLLSYRTSGAMRVRPACLRKR